MHQTPILWSFRRCPYAMRARLTILYADTGTKVIDESRDIMLWALRQNDPENWLSQSDKAATLIDTNDGPFKQALDHTKYAVRFPDRDLGTDRVWAITPTCWATRPQWPTPRSSLSCGNLPTQTAIGSQDWPHLIRWLTAFEGSASFKAIMVKRPIWAPGAAPLYFP